METVITLRSLDISLQSVFSYLALLRVTANKKIRHDLKPLNSLKMEFALFISTSELKTIVALKQKKQLTNTGPMVMSSNPSRPENLKFAS